jgi:hypothetical protein
VLGAHAALMAAKACGKNNWIGGRKQRTQADETVLRASIMA